MLKSHDINCSLITSRLSARGGSSYVWSPEASLNNPNIPDPVASPERTTLYTVKVFSNKGCTSKDSIRIVVTSADSGRGYLMPNTFTPNNDNRNDCFGVKHWGRVTNLNFSVYTRWGQKIFHTSDPSICWNGSYKANPVNGGTFVYQIWAKTKCGEIYRKGAVVLIR